MHQLEQEYLSKHLMEMALVQEAVCLAFDADKMNVESLGNGDAHLHWHLFPRHHGDTAMPGPVWWINKEEMYDDQYKITQAEIDEYKVKLINTIEYCKSKKSR